MTWTYTTSDLATSTKDQVRLLIGDTVSTDPQLQDEEISYFISMRSSPVGAAAECCRTLSAQYSRSVDSAAGGTKEAYSQMAKAYALRAAQFEAQAAAGGAGLPYAGGISVADKSSQEENSDRVSPQFSIGMDDNLLPVPPAGNETSSDLSGLQE